MRPMNASHTNTINYALSILEKSGDSDSPWYTLAILSMRDLLNPDTRFQINCWNPEDERTIIAAIQEFNLEVISEDWREYDDETEEPIEGNEAGICIFIDGVKTDQLFPLLLKINSLELIKKQLPYVYHAPIGSLLVAEGTIQ